MAAFYISAATPTSRADLQQSRSKALPKPPPEEGFLAPRPYKAGATGITINLPPQPWNTSNDSRIMSPFAIAAPSSYSPVPSPAPSPSMPTKKPLPVRKQLPLPATPRDSPGLPSSPASFSQGPIRRRPIGSVPSSPAHDKTSTSRSQSDAPTLLLPSTVYTPTSKAKQDAPSTRTESDILSPRVTPNPAPESKPQTSPVRPLLSAKTYERDDRRDEQKGSISDRRNDRKDDTRDDPVDDTKDERSSRVMSYSSFISAYSQDSLAPTGISSSTSDGTVSTSASSYMYSYKDRDQFDPLSPGYEIKEQSALSYVLAGHAYDDSDYMTSALTSPASLKSPSLASPMSPKVQQNEYDSYSDSLFSGFQQPRTNLTAIDDSIDDDKGITGVTRTPVRKQLQSASGAAKTADAVDLHQQSQPQPQTQIREENPRVLSKDKGYTPTRAPSPPLPTPLARAEVDEPQPRSQSPKKRVGAPVGLPGRNIRPNRKETPATTPVTASREPPKGEAAPSNADVLQFETMGTGLSKLETKVKANVKRKEVPFKGQAKSDDLSPAGYDSNEEERGRQQLALAQDQASSTSRGGQPSALSAALSMAASRSSSATRVPDTPPTAKDTTGPSLAGRDVGPAKTAQLQTDLPLQTGTPQPSPATPSRSEPGRAGGSKTPGRPSAFPTYTVAEVVAPQAGPNGVYPAPPPTAAHFNCMQNHRDMFRDANTNYPLSCQTCQTFERSVRWRCKWCYVRICTSCRGTLHAQANHDLATLIQILNSPSSPEAAGSEAYYGGDGRMRTGGGSADLFVIREG